MSNQQTEQTSDARSTEQAKARREFLIKAGTLAATVPPAMAVLLEISSKPAQAQPTYRI